MHQVDGHRQLQRDLVARPFHVQRAFPARHKRSRCVRRHLPAALLCSFPRLGHLLPQRHDFGGEGLHFGRGPVREALVEAVVAHGLVAKGCEAPGEGAYDDVFKIRAGHAAALYGVDRLVQRLGPGHPWRRVGAGEDLHEAVGPSDDDVEVTVAPARERSRHDTAAMASHEPATTPRRVDGVAATTAS